MKKKLLFLPIVLLAIASSVFIWVDKEDPVHFSGKNLTILHEEENDEVSLESDQESEPHTDNLDPIIYPSFKYKKTQCKKYH